MDKEELKNRIDFKNVKEKTTLDKHGIIERKLDYLVDFEGNYIWRLTPLDFKLIEKILDLEKRIEKLEEKVE